MKPPDCMYCGSPNHSSFACPTKDRRGEPAIQNIPLRTEIGRKVRETLLPPKLETLPVDYAELEIRILAQLAEER